MRKPSEKSMKTRYSLLILLLLGFLFRLIIIFCLPVRTFEDTIKRYHHAAVNLIHGNGYSHLSEPPYQPSFYKPPVYSIFLAGIYKFFGINFAAVKIIQAAIDTLGCLLLFFLTSAYFVQGAAFTVFWLALFFPITAVYTNVLNPESLTLFFMTLSLLIVSKALISQKPVYFFFSGLSVMLMSYCRQEFFPLAFLFGAYLCLMQLKKFQLIKKLFLYLLGLLVIMIPWVIRNYRLTHEFIPLSVGAGAGLTFYFGTLGDITNDDTSLNKFFREHPEVEAKYHEWYRRVLFNRTGIDEKDEYDKAFMDMAFERIKEDPLNYIATGIKRLPRAWINLHADEFVFLDTQKLRVFHPDLRKTREYLSKEPKEVFILSLKYILLAINIFYLCLALGGIYFCRQKIMQLLFVIIPLAYAELFFFFIHPSPNYTIPYWPCIIFFSGIGMFQLKNLSCRNEEE